MICTCTSEKLGVIRFVSWKAETLRLAPQTPVGLCLHDIKEEASMRRWFQLRFPILFGMALLLIAGSESAAQQGRSTESNKEGKPYLRWLWEFQQRAFPLGYIPDGARLRALRQIERWKESRIQAVVQGDRWINIGPAPIKGGQLANNDGARPVSGRVADVAVDPSNANHWLIGAAQGGIWETKDGGQTWAARSDDKDSLAMGQWHSLKGSAVFA